MFFIFLTVSFIAINTSTSPELHQLCLNIFESSPEKDLHQAFFCGRKLPWGSDRLWLSQCSLIHVLVVSGFHLGLVKKFFRFMGVTGHYSREALESILLGIYALMTTFQPPAVRAWLESSLSRRYPPWVAIGLSSLGSLLIDPQWFLSLSWQLSVCARVALGWGGTSGFKLLLRVYLLLIPLLCQAHASAALLGSFLIFPLTVSLLWTGVAYLLLETIPGSGFIVFYEWGEFLLFSCRWLGKQIFVHFPPLSGIKPWLFLHHLGEGYGGLYSFSLLMGNYLWGIRSGLDRWIKATTLPLHPRKTHQQRLSLLKTGVLVAIFVFQPTPLRDFGMTSNSKGLPKLLSAKKSSSVKAARSRKIKPPNERRKCHQFRCKGRYSSPRSRATGS